MNPTSATLPGSSGEASGNSLAPGYDRTIVRGSGPSFRTVTPSHRSHAINSVAKKRQATPPMSLKRIRLKTRRV